MRKKEKAQKQTNIFNKRPLQSHSDAEVQDSEIKAAEVKSKIRLAYVRTIQNSSADGK